MASTLVGGTESAGFTPFVLRLSKYERTLAQRQPLLCKPSLILRQAQDERLSVHLPRSC